MACLFCRIVNKDIPAEIVFEDEQVVAFNDINPQAPTHILIIPKRHIATINDLNHVDSDLISQLFFCAQSLAVKNKLDASGYRLVFNCNEQGGQAVYHIHLHLLGGRQLNWPPG